MTENEITLIRLIRNNKVPEQAILIAIEIILLFLKSAETNSHEINKIE
jgi:hypothetical protein